jgi:heme/copper-type cytochrome/quinol oxidase subunit 3
MASEGVPLDVGGQPRAAAADVGPEPPAVRRERGLRALSVAARLLAGASVFFFLAFLFAYFYLRSINQNHLWRPAHVKPDQALGAAFIACVVVSALLAVLAGRRERGESTSWLPPAVGALVLGLAAVALQCIEYTAQHFGPTDGAFASVFCAWTGFYLIAVLFTMYWLEIVVATELRERRAPTARPGEGETVYEDPDKLLPRGLPAVVFYWAFLAFLGLLAYVTLYLL